MRDASNSSLNALSAHRQLGRGDFISARCDAKCGAGKLRSATTRPQVLLRLQGRQMLRDGLLQKLIAARTAGHTASSERWKQRV